MTWLTNNLGTILVALLLCAVVFFLVRGMIRDKKAGKAACSCGGACGGCSGCAMSGSCHPAAKK